MLRNAVDSYMLRDGYDEEDNVLTGSNQNSHIYMLQNYQLSGHHEMGKWDVNWNGSYSLTSSDEPDRRQVMFVQKSDGTMGLFNLNAQGTMRYYGALDEDEWVADMNTQYRFGEANKVRFGVARKINPEILPVLNFTIM